MKRSPKPSGGYRPNDAVTWWQSRELRRLEQSPVKTFAEAEAVIARCGGVTHAERFPMASDYAVKTFAERLARIGAQ